MPPKKTAVTPRGIIKSALRSCWMTSRERGTAIKRDGYTCQVCGKKQSKAKGKEVSIEVHHLKPGGINWDRIMRVLTAELFCPPQELITLCREHHLEAHHTGEL